MSQEIFNSTNKLISHQFIQKFILILLLLKVTLASMKNKRTPIRIHGEITLRVEAVGVNRKI